MIKYRSAANILSEIATSRNREKHFIRDNSPQVSTLYEIEERPHDRRVYGDASIHCSE